MHLYLQNKTLINEPLGGCRLKVLWLEEAKKEFINKLQMKWIILPE